MIKIEQFKEKHLQDAACVFINNYNEYRQFHPELPLKYGQEDEIIKMLSDLIEKNPAVVAMANEKVIGYMSGFKNIQSLKGSFTGVYTPEWAHAANYSCKDEVYYKLYSYLAKDWVRDRNYTHTTTFFGNDNELLNLYNELGFGLLVIDGLRTLQEITEFNEKDINIREATEADVVELRDMYTKINKHLASTPVFLYSQIENLTDQAICSRFMGNNVRTFVALKERKIISGIRVMLNKGPGCRIVQDKGTLGINFGYTYSNIRGSGVATILLNEVIKWGANNGMVRCTVDFESQNRQALRFWLRHFKPICKTVLRKVDDRF